MHAYTKSVDERFKHHPSLRSLKNYSLCIVYKTNMMKKNTTAMQAIPFHFHSNFSHHPFNVYPLGKQGPVGRFCSGPYPGAPAYRWCCNWCGRCNWDFPNESDDNMDLAQHQKICDETPVRCVLCNQTVYKDKLDVHWTHFCSGIKLCFQCFHLYPIVSEDTHYENCLKKPTIDCNTVLISWQPDFKLYVGANTFILPFNKNGMTLLKFIEQQTPTTIHQEEDNHFLSNTRTVCTVLDQDVSKEEQNEVRNLLLEAKSCKCLPTVLIDLILEYAYSGCEIEISLSAEIITGCCNNPYRCTLKIQDVQYGPMTHIITHSDDAKPCFVSPTAQLVDAYSWKCIHEIPHGCEFVGVMPTCN